MRIVVAMSGGVDSSVAAALLVEQGYEVVGVSMQLYDNSSGFGTCCTIDDLNDARRVAARIGIPHYVLNFESHFHAHVQQNFIDEYARGRTPIPCAHCNSEVKFSELAARASSYGAAHLATGHYARLERRDDGRIRLRRGRDAAKDQSYFLFSLTQLQLEMARFPVGDLPKDEVRAHAHRLGLAVADKPDSQEICFVPDGDYATFLERADPALATPGPIVDNAGRTLGTHGGVHRFTVGQRKGLGLSAGVPLYVVAIDAAAKSVTVGPREALERRGLSAHQVNWIAGHAPSGWTAVTAQIRHRHRAAPARVRALDERRAELEFDEPQTAVSPGQAVVFYDGDEVVGGGWID
ncbi:MAG TPA: tRNA 2-thiouridine(34) synthase MnmA [Vicinamibacterales bacterium]|nr:tRNA 2-thiouridine(34) synthase MnmA [Vicinamibacterales bacterium]